MSRFTHVTLDGKRVQNYHDPEHIKTAREGAKDAEACGIRAAGEPPARPDDRSSTRSLDNSLGRK